MNKLKYTHFDIVFQEVPEEVSLVFNISGCPHKCEGCHSKYLWEYHGEYLSKDIDRILSQYQELITCVCFMGGDQNLQELSKLLYRAKNTYKLKTCVYSGSDDLSLFENLLQFIDYLKIGSYKKELGGLNSPTTNQRFYKIDGNKLKDITDIFWDKRRLKI